MSTLEVVERAKAFAEILRRRKISIRAFESGDVTVSSPDGHVSYNVIPCGGGNVWLRAVSSEDEMRELEEGLGKPVDEVSELLFDIVQALSDLSGSTCWIDTELDGWRTRCGDYIESSAKPDFCPSCGRKLVVWPR